VHPVGHCQQPPLLLKEYPLAHVIQAEDPHKLQFGSLQAVNVVGVEEVV
jgi:hypothetical protein